MRIISVKYIVNFYEKHPASKSSLDAFVSEVKAADWQKPNDIIERFPSADLITSKRYVFNIKGNNFRLVADVEFTKKLVFVVWIGTHAEYDKIDVKTVRYVKSD
ncbi:mRNA interferase HigB [Larkinella arboricola]|uniref:mRNA interferase HigB n=1 Tax=Larkinella arboricola TaxID=643671 RepID=A0A327WQS1_LARAB|nr:type II toxin-antitoxin system HigB family toxin [Larkinella arboricola]RAJ90819.1 mRNA interferase HigB [Larkinella arboricola]